MRALALPSSGTARPGPNTFSRRGPHSHGGRQLVRARLPVSKRTSATTAERGRAGRTGQGELAIRLERHHHPLTRERAVGGVAFLAEFIGGRSGLSRRFHWA